MKNSSGQVEVACWNQSFIFRLYHDLGGWSVVWQMCCCWNQNHIESIGSCTRSTLTVGVEVVVDFPDLAIANEGGVAVGENHILAKSTMRWAVAWLNLKFGVVRRPVSDEWHDGAKVIHFGTFEVANAFGAVHTWVNRVSLCQKRREPLIFLIRKILQFQPAWKFADPDFVGTARAGQGNGLIEVT